MTNKIFETIEIEHTELAKMWEESEKERVDLQRRVCILEDANKHWRNEAEKFERFWVAEKVKNNN